MAPTKVATKIKPNVFTREIHRKAMTGEPSIQEVDGRGLGGGKGLAIEGAAVMIND
jgi:hypothetical protein